MNETAAPTASISNRARQQDHAFRLVTMLSALAVVAIFFGVLVSLLIEAWPALERFGLPFLWTESWNPVKGTFGAAAPVYGTLVTSTIAIVIGVPVSLGIAIFPAAPPAWHRH